MATATSQRWLRIIPVALIMYTISYIDRTNVSLALDPKISNMMKDLGMDDEMKGRAMGIFFIGYMLLQIPGGYLASRWSAKRFVSVLLVVWGVFAVLCGMARSFWQFEIARFMLGVAEGGVWPAVLVLLANWFPRAERARANAWWILCLPLAVVFSAPLSNWLLGRWQWQIMIIVEGIFPFLWLPIWWCFIDDHPHEAKWLDRGELESLQATLHREAAELDALRPIPLWQAFAQPVALVLMAVYFLQNCAVYGCMPFLTENLNGSGVTPGSVGYGLLFAFPYVITAILIVVNSSHSDKKAERRGHVAAVYVLGGICMIASVKIAQLPHGFWPSYAVLCLGVAGPFAAIPSFWAIPTETMSRRVVGPVMGLVNAIGNLGGFFGPSVVGYLKKHTGGITVPFMVLGVGLLMAAGLCALLPGRKKNPTP